MRSLQPDLAALADGSEVYRVIDSTLIPAKVRVRTCRKGLFAAQAAFGRSVSKTEWEYGFKVGLAVSPTSVVTTFGLAPADCDERPIIGAFLVFSDGHDAYLADKGFLARVGEALEEYGAPVIATPQ